jgi:alpha-beta hydrolase superfamily lysophospholipase
MNANAIGGAVAGPYPGSHQPIYFPSGEHQLFGWVHHPTIADASGWGVVVCKPFGYEALCAHRSVRKFADAAAALGMPVLRFDYAGSGDSVDIAANAEQIELWTRDIARAVAELRRLTGVSRVCLLGFRLGALLAVLASRQCPVDALALVAPVLSGKRYLKEIRTLQLAADAAARAAPSAGQNMGQNTAQNTSEGRREAAGAGGMEASGYVLAAASVATLSQADATGALAPTITEVLIIDRGDLPVARAWSQALSAAGARAEYQALPGFVEMMMTAPQFAVPPEEMLRATRGWLERLRDQTPGQAPAAAGNADAGLAAYILALRGDSDDPGDSITEHGVFLGEDQAVFGIVATPCGGENRRRAVILLNTGADYHMGASRMYVALARRWARRGYYVLRLDLAGLGDSPARAGRVDNEVFSSDALEDIRAAIGFLQQRFEIREINLVGVCSGAYHALRAAVAGFPVKRILMVNIGNFYWDDSMSLEKALQATETVRNPGLYGERIFSARAWRRFLTGQVNILRIIRVYLSRPAVELKSKLRDAARAVGIRLHRDLGRELDEVIARGVRVVFVFARGEPGLGLLRIEAGSKMKRLGERCRIVMIDSADHTFSRSGPREVLENVLSEELYARQELRPGAAEEERLRPA